MDEGQHLQSVYPTARRFGGPGLFGLSPAARMTDASSLVSPASRQALLDAWLPFWDTSKPVLLEKSPPNLVRMRFLQALFPEASFIVVVRHPVPVTLATHRWLPARPESLLRHWATAHRIVLEDAPHIQALRIVRYEDLVAASEQTIGAILAFLGLDGGADLAGIETGLSDPYFSAWEAHGLTIDQSTARVAALFGYDVRHPWDQLPLDAEVAALVSAEPRAR
jgi:Sulfotransferase family